MVRIKTAVFVSNYFNHHQKPFSDEMVRLLGDGYSFIATEPMEEERRSLGWKNEHPAYVLCAYENEENRKKAINLINSADVVVFGSAPEEMIRQRIQSRKLLFRYSERPLKDGPELHKYLIRLVKWRRKNPQAAPIYLLCSSAYTCADYARFGLFGNRAYKWGYFPAVREYPDIEGLLDSKHRNSILWVARFLHWKHPELVIETAKRLKAAGYDISVKMIGNGQLDEFSRALVQEAGLTDTVRFLGAVSPEEVRAEMEKSQIFLFTSDFHEGWGAVLNEAMNSGCAVVASHACGAAPFLINDRENGLIFENENIGELYKKTKWLLDNPAAARSMGKKAYETMLTVWSPATAAARLVSLSDALLGNRPLTVYEGGPCSSAPRISNHWYPQRKEELCGK